MVNLEALVLEGLESPDLTLLSALPRLEQLHLEWCVGDIDYHLVGELPRLRFLYVRSEEPGAGPAMREIELHRLTRLEHLELAAIASTPVEIDPRFLTVTPGLVWLRLENLALGADGIAPLCAAAAHLEDIYLTPMAPELTAQLEACWTVETPVFWIRDESLSIAPLDVILEHPAGASARYSLGLDVAGAWGMETNVDAEILLVDLLRESAPEIAERIRFDSESQAVWLLSDHMADLRSVSDLVRREARHRLAPEE
jgi:hypothetical protein